MWTARQRGAQVTLREGSSGQAGEDIADAVAHLVTTEFITGQIIAVDGGRTLV